MAHETQYFFDILGESSHKKSHLSKFEDKKLNLLYLAIVLEEYVLSNYVQKWHNEKVHCSAEISYLLNSSNVMDTYSSEASLCNTVP